MSRSNAASAGAGLTLDQKVRLLRGADFWSLHPEPVAGAAPRAETSVEPPFRGLAGWTVIDADPGELRTAGIVLAQRVS